MPEIETNFPGEEEEILKKIRITTQKKKIKIRASEKLQNSVLESCMETTKKGSRDGTPPLSAALLQRHPVREGSAGKTECLIKSWCLKRAVGEITELCMHPTSAVRKTLGALIEVRLREHMEHGDFIKDRSVPGFIQREQPSSGDGRKEKARTSGAINWHSAVNFNSMSVPTARKEPE